MCSAEQRPLPQALTDEIDRLVATSVETRSLVESGRSAASLARLFPGSGVSAEEISDEIIAAAIRAGATLEMSRP